MNRVETEAPRASWRTPWPYIVVLMLMMHATLIISMVYLSMQTPVNLVPRVAGP